MLMAQSNIDKTRIDNIERQLYKATPVASYPGIPQKEHETIYAVLPDNKIKYTR
jgi:hypothetical protein